MRNWLDTLFSKNVTRSRGLETTDNRDGGLETAAYEEVLVTAGAFIYLLAMREFGKLLALFGGVITIIGLALWGGFGPSWLGRLPGDIRVERGNSTLYFPIVTCLIVSILFSLILSFFRR